MKQGGVGKPGGFTNRVCYPRAGGAVVLPTGLSNRLTPGPDWLDMSPTHKRGRDIGRPRWRFGLVSDSQRPSWRYRLVLEWRFEFEKTLMDESPVGVNEESGV